MTVWAAPSPLRRRTGGTLFPSPAGCSPPSGPQQKHSMNDSNSRRQNSNSNGTAQLRRTKTTAEKNIQCREGEEGKRYHHRSSVNENEEDSGKPRASYIMYGSASVKKPAAILRCSQQSPQRSWQLLAITVVPTVLAGLQGLNLYRFRHGGYLVNNLCSVIRLGVQVTSQLPRHTQEMGAEPA
ncbi:uncharacterized protein LOC135386156 [Ornithodoros turicata]|uniref:uncharacterized protein LOC135386156 n=1 Tax=Ornithodoros turicata TaxID=34597 RepID=UPI00313A3694